MNQHPITPTMAKVTSMQSLHKGDKNHFFLKDWEQLKLFA